MALCLVRMMKTKLPVVFSKKDFAGFKDIGQGGKRDDPTSTGMFGRSQVFSIFYVDSMFDERLAGVFSVACQLYLNCQEKQSLASLSSLLIFLLVCIAGEDNRPLVRSFRLQCLSFYICSNHVMAVMILTFTSQVEAL